MTDNLKEAHDTIKSKGFHPIILKMRSGETTSIICCYHLDEIL